MNDPARKAILLDLTVGKTLLGEIMPQYLVAIHHPDNYDPSREGDAMIRDIDVLNQEMMAAGARLSLAASPPPAVRSRCGRSPMARCSSPMGHTLRPRSTSAAFGYWKPLTWTRPWRGAERPSSPVGHRSRCARLGGIRKQLSGGIGQAPFSEEKRKSTGLKETR